jgi:hypothetical protein
MKMIKVANILGALLLVSVAGSAVAAETAGGVAKAIADTTKSVKDAQEAAKAGNKEACVANIKQGKQHYKEITGSSAGVALQQAMNKMNEGQKACNDGDTAKAAEVLGEAAKGLEDIASKSGRDKVTTPEPKRNTVNAAQKSAQECAD